MTAVLKDAAITYLPRVDNPASFKALTLKKALTGIKKGTFKDRIENARLQLLVGDDEGYAALKKELPSVCFNGTFAGKLTNANFVASSGLFGIDVDHLSAEQLPVVRGLLEADPSTVFVFTSPSGEGLKAALRIDPAVITCDDDFKVVFEQVAAYWAGKGVVIDGSCKDVRRVAFVSDDPALYFNDAAQVFAAEAPAKKPPVADDLDGLPMLDDDGDYTPINETDATAEPLPDVTLENAARYLPPDCKNRQDWLNVGAALHHQFSGADAALVLFDDWSQAVPGYTTYESVKKAWESFKRPTGSKVRTFRSILQAYYAAHPDKISADFRPIPAHEFINAKPQDWFIKNILPKAEVGTIYGQSGVCKTFFALDIAASIARGTPWRGWKVKQGRVVYIAAEGAGGFKTRLAAYAKHHGIDLATMPLFIIPQAPNFLSDDDPLAVAAAIGPCDLIVLDTVSAVTPGGNENSSEGMGLLIAKAKQLHNATGATVLLIDHSGKNTSLGMRGWSGKYAAMDFVIEIINNGGLMARIEKLKDGVEGTRLPFKLFTVDLGQDEDGDPITSCVIEHLDFVPGAAPAKPPGAWEQRVIDAFKSLIPVGVATEYRIPVNDVLIAATVNVAFDTDKKDRRREVATRALNSLKSSGYITLDDGYVVYTP